MSLMLLKDAMLVRCVSRRQQLVVVGGMGVLSLAFFLGAAVSIAIAEAARATLPEFAERDELGFYRNPRQRMDLYFTMAMWYVLGLGAAVPGVILCVCGVLNFGRWMTFTGVGEKR